MIVANGRFQDLDIAIDVQGYIDHVRMKSVECHKGKFVGVWHVVAQVIARSVKHFLIGVVEVHMTTVRQMIKQGGFAAKAFGQTESPQRLNRNARFQRLNALLETGNLAVSYKRYLHGAILFDREFSGPALSFLHRK